MQQIGSHRIECKCKGKCNSAQCSYIKSQINCSNHCHPGGKCGNGEATFIPKKCSLDDKDIKTLQNPDGWLTDKQMTVVNTILQQDYPMADGLLDTVLQQNFLWNLPTSQYVQFLQPLDNYYQHQQRQHSRSINSVCV